MAASRSLTGIKKPGDGPGFFGRFSCGAIVRKSVAAVAHAIAVAVAVVAVQDAVTVEVAIGAVGRMACAGCAGCPGRSDWRCRPGRGRRRGRGVPSCRPPDATDRRLAAPSGAHGTRSPSGPASMARHPDVLVAAPFMVARCPDVAGALCRRGFVHRRRRSYLHDGRVLGVIGQTLIPKLAPDAAGRASE